MSGFMCVECESHYGDHDDFDNCVECEEPICEDCQGGCLWRKGDGPNVTICTNCRKDNITDKQRLEMLEHLIDVSPAVHGETYLREVMREDGRMKTPARYDDYHQVKDSDVIEDADDEAEEEEEQEEEKEKEEEEQPRPSRKRARKPRRRKRRKNNPNPASSAPGRKKRSRKNVLFN
jgi:hypothetical protein